MIRLEALHMTTNQYSIEFQEQALWTRPVYTDSLSFFIETV